MTASNLAVVFQPGLVSTRREGSGRGGAGGEGALLGFPGFVGGRIPSSASSVTASPAAGPSTSGQPTSNTAAQDGAGEHGRGKEVLEFLIEYQHHFMLGLEPPLPNPPMSGPSHGVAASTTAGAKSRSRGEDDSGYGGTSPSLSSAGRGPGIGSVGPTSSTSGTGGVASGASADLTPGASSGQRQSATAIAGPALASATAAPVSAQVAPTNRAVPSSTTASSHPSATVTGTGSGAGIGADLARRGSDKSVERRRLRKSHEGQLQQGDGGKVKRSRTLPGQRSKKAQGDPGPTTHGTGDGDGGGIATESTGTLGAPGGEVGASLGAGLFSGRPRKGRRSSPTPSPDSGPAPNISSSGTAAADTSHVTATATSSSSAASHLSPGSGSGPGLRQARSTSPKLS